MKNKGFVNMILVAIIVVLAGAVGFLVVERNKKRPYESIVENKSSDKVGTSTELNIQKTVEKTLPKNKIDVPVVPKLGDIETIQNLLNTKMWVRVVVVLNVEEVSGHYDEKINTQIKNAVLATLNKDDFKWSEQIDAQEFVGNISKTGMEKLLKDSRVKAIYSDIARPTI